MEITANDIGEVQLLHSLDRFTPMNNGTKDEHEKKFMSFMNFTDEMYEVIRDEDYQGQNNCMESMYEVGQNYRMVHGYISLIVCIAGIFMNILIIMVLTRKEMSSPINRMLTALAIADMLVMVEYIPFTLHMYIFELPEEEQYSYSWAVFVLFHSHFTQILHTINIQLTISMSIWRYVALKCSGRTSTYLTFERCNLCILAAYICPIIICIPNYLTFSIYHLERLYIKTPFHIIFERKEVLHMKNFLKLCEHAGEILNLPMDCKNIVTKHDWYTVGLSKLAKANDELLHRINFWTFSVFVKLIPCIMLTFFMCWLVNALYKTKQRYKMLHTNKAPQTATVPTQSTARKILIGYTNTTIPECTSIKMNDLTGHQLDDQGKIPGINMNIVNSNIVDNFGIKETTHLDLRPSPSTTLQKPCKNLITFDNNPEPTISNNVTRKSNGQPAVTMRKFSRQNLTRVSSIRAISKRRRCKSLPASTNNDQSKFLQTNAVVKHNNKVANRTDRTSKLLIAVLCLFLITEIPQGIMAFLSGIYGEQFFRKCYNTWAEVWDVLALMNSAINFILYCFMSKQFRLQFHLLFKVGRFFRPSWINMAKCNNCNNQTISSSVV